MAWGPEMSRNHHILNGPASWKGGPMCHLRAVALLVSHLERGLEEVHEQPGCSVETRDRSGRCEAFEAPIA